MQKKLSDIEKAELMQSLKALYIPLSLFLSCVSFSAGVFLVYNGESFGWAFIVGTVLVALSAFFALVKFQNPFRVKGLIASELDEEEVGSFVKEPETAADRESPRETIATSEGQSSSEAGKERAESESAGV